MAICAVTRPKPNVCARTLHSFPTTCHIPGLGKDGLISLGAYNVFLSFLVEVVNAVEETALEAVFLAEAASGVSAGKRGSYYVPANVSAYR